MTRQRGRKDGYGREHAFKGERTDIETGHNTDKESERKEVQETKRTKMMGLGAMGNISSGREVDGANIKGWCIRQGSERK